MHTKSGIQSGKSAFLIALLLTVLGGPTPPSAHAEGGVTAEEQRLRELFLRVREENRREAGLPAGAPGPPPASSPKPTGTAPKATPPKPSPPPSPRRETPPAPKPTPPAAVRKVTPAPAPIPAEPKPSPVAAPAKVAPTAPEEASTPTESGDVGDKIRDLAGELGDRLSSLPRTPQGRAIEDAPVAPPEPDLEPEPVPVTKTASVPKTLPRKPEPVLRIAPEAPAKPAPALQPVASPVEERVAKPDAPIPEVDLDALFEDPALDLKQDPPSRNETVAATAESIRRSLLEDSTKPSAEVALATPKSTLAEPPAPPLPEPPVPSPPKPKPVAASPSPGTPAPFTGGMTGAVFARFAHHALALATTAVVTTRTPPSSPVPKPSEPDLEVTPGTAEALAAPSPPDEDEVPEYVKAARRLTEPLETFPALTENLSPPGLNDFVISATHQTDFDMASSSITFAGHVVVESSRFHLTCDKFIVHMLPDQKGMEYGEALGNVVIRMMDGRKPTGHTGLARSAIYRPEEGEITLSGWPRIVEETKELVGITADAKMVLSTSGSVRTIGRNRTILKQ